MLRRCLFTNDPGWIFGLWRFVDVKHQNASWTRGQQRFPTVSIFFFFFDIKQRSANNRTVLRYINFCAINDNNDGYSHPPRNNLWNIRLTRNNRRFLHYMIIFQPDVLPYRIDYKSIDIETNYEWNSSIFHL